MKHGFKSGLILGVVIGWMIGYFISHLWVWVVIGMAVCILVAASRPKRPKLFPPQTTG